MLTKKDLFQRVTSLGWIRLTKKVLESLSLKEGDSLNVTAVRRTVLLLKSSLDPRSPKFPWFTTKLGPFGRLTLPEEIKLEADLRVGDTVELELGGNFLVITRR